MSKKIFFVIRVFPPKIKVLRSRSFQYIDSIVRGVGWVVYLSNAEPSVENAGNQMDRDFYQKIASNIMIVTGLALMLVNTLSLVLEVSVVGENYEHMNDLVPGYSYQVQDTSRLQVMLEEPVGSFDIEGVNNLIFESIVHSDKRKVQIFENWLLWLGGKFYEPLSRTQDPRRIVSGEGGLCSEVSAVFNSIARLNGFETRFIGLGGHVVSEIKTDNGWRVVDPDYGITYPVGHEDLEKKRGVLLMRQLLKNRGYKEEIIDGYIRIFQSSADNTVTEVDVALSPRLHVIELAAEWLKWIIPMIIIFLGVISSRKHIIIAPTRTEPTP